MVIVGMNRYFMVLSLPPVYVPKVLEFEDETGVFWCGTLSSSVPRSVRVVDRPRVAPGRTGAWDS